MVRKADIVFCLDSSASMRPCFDALRRHLADFVDGLSANGQFAWDLRFGLIAHAASETPDGSHVFSHITLSGEDAFDLLYGSSAANDPSKMFTSEPAVVAASLDRLSAKGDEATLVAIDFCLDMPWRDDPVCHRAVIVLTDEPIETGVMVGEQVATLSGMIQKIQALGVLLFVVGPESAAFNTLAEADRSEYEVVDENSDGLARVDFGELLSQIGKSVSASRYGGQVAPKVTRGLFGQAEWGRSSATFGGA